MYVDFDYFTTLYPEVEESAFNKFAFKAVREIDNFTTGVDGVRKLQLYFPEDEYDAKAVKDCMCELIALMDKFEKLEEAISYKPSESTGAMTSGVISSISSGRESISYATNGATEIEKAVADPRARARMYARTIFNYLSGCKDKNGVNLLYMGVYV